MEKKGKGPDYEKMYFALFNRLTSAIKAVEEHNFGQAVEILKEAQKETEQMYIEAGE